MFHVSMLLFGAQDNQSSRSPASAILAIFLGTLVSLCSFQSGAFAARYICSRFARAQPEPATSSDHRTVESSKSDNIICALTTANLKQPAQSPSAKPALANPSADPIESAQNRSTKEHAIAVEKQKKQHFGEVHGRTELSSLFSTTACLLVTSSVCVSLSAWQFSRDRQEWATFWLAGLLAPVGALLRWQLGVLNSTPKSVPPESCCIANESRFLAVALAT